MNFIKKNILYIQYVFMVSFLFIGMYKFSGFTYFLPLISYLCFFSVLYFGLKKMKLSKVIDAVRSKLSFIKLNENQRKITIYFFVIFFIVFAISHLIYLKEIPVIRAFFSWDYNEIVWTRRNITLGKHWFWNYWTMFLLKAIVPLSMLLLYINKRNKTFLILLVFSFLYGLCTMQKSYLVTLYLPLILYTLLSKSFFKSIVFSIITTLGVSFLVIITNPSMKVQFLPSVEQEKVHLVIQGFEGKSTTVVEEETEEAGYPVVKKVFNVISNRLFVVPGEMVYVWFKHIPADLPFLKGDGYRFVADLKNTELKEYAVELYPLARKKFADRGYIGSLNVASFMYDYSNFGYFGLFLSAIILAFMLRCIEHVFDSYKIMFALNAFFIFMLSTSALTTILLSGGWVLIVLLYLLFRKDLNPKKA